MYTYVAADGDHNGNTTTEDADQIYAIGSGMKLLINFALFRIIEHAEVVLEDDKPVIQDSEVRKIMENAWETPAFELCNKLREHRGHNPWLQPRDLNPLVLEVMTHMGAFPAHQRGLYGPDGNFLMSEETFGRTFAAMVDNHLPVSGEQFCYSNWNAILLGFIIIYATDRSLADALKRIVIQPLGMSNTVLDRETFRQKQDMIVPPYINTALHVSQRSSLPDFFDNDAALASGGGFSCVRDMTKLLECMLRPFLDLDERMTATLFSSVGVFDDESGATSLPTGIYATLDSKATGSESFERIPGSKTPQLGLDSRTPVKAISKAGAIRGYACHFYMIPSKQLIIVVMTNSSGIADSSQRVAQYLIQQSLRLEPPIESFEGKASEIYETNRLILKNEATCHRVNQGFNATEREQLRGHYIDTRTQQRIIVQKSDQSQDQDQMLIYVEEGSRDESERSSEMTLIKIHKDILALLPHPGYLGIDAYESWRNLGLEVKRYDNGKVYALAKAMGYSVLGPPAEEHSRFREYYEKIDA